MTKAKKSLPAPEKIDPLAEDYLDFWQENLSSWATDPKAFEKWISLLGNKKAD